MYADRLINIYKVDIMTYSKSSDESIVQSQLNRWAETGLIEIIKPLAQCEDMEPCIKLLGWIQPRRPDGGPVG